MPRPMKFDRDEAIDAVMRLIWRDGYEASSVQSIAKALGITRSSYYNAFESRDALFALALDRYFSVIPEHVLFTPKAEQDFPKVLTVLMREVCQVRTTVYAKLGCMAANCLAEILPSDSEAAKAVQAGTDAMIERLRDLVAGAIDRGELPKDTDLDATALAIHAMIMGVNLQSKVVTDGARLWASVQKTLIGLGLYKE